MEVCKNSLCNHEGVNGLSALGKLVYLCNEGLLDILSNAHIFLMTEKDELDYGEIVLLVF
jgi:hypothetical protein